jgi:MFS family permease
MKIRQRKIAYFLLEGVNSYATTFYFYYLFFFMAGEFGFGNMANLFLSALNGFIYMFAAIGGGRFGERYGYQSALWIGFGGMALALAVGLALTSIHGQVMVLAVWTIALCFTWPNLEALASEKENAYGTQRMVGIYNMVWAGASALAFFTGGAVLEHLGGRSLFWVPLGMHLAQLAVLLWLRRKGEAPSEALEIPTQPSPELKLNPRPIARTKTFLRMAWIANPFAYVAINTVVPVVPGIARTLELTPTWAGVFCSIWFFARGITFVGLWLWAGWHYQGGWFFSAFVLLIASFALILLVPSLAVLILAQVVFGYALGLIYYSSLFYSMDAGDTKAEHGGVHEAAIGAGIFMGPAVGGASLYFFPEHPQSATVAVSALLVTGLLLAFVVWKRGGK